MSRTRKERLKWKRKERLRTGQSDPAKIKLHRRRFLDQLQQRSVQGSGYQALLFRARLEYGTEQETKAYLDGEWLETFPSALVNPASSHYVFVRRESEFDPLSEAGYLRRHVRRARRQGFVCHLRETVSEGHICSAILDCPYRQWSHSRALPMCTLT